MDKYEKGVEFLKKQLSQEDFDRFTGYMTSFSVRYLVFKMVDEDGYCHPCCAFTDGDEGLWIIHLSNEGLTIGMCSDYLGDCDPYDLGMMFSCAMESMADSFEECEELNLINFERLEVGSEH